MRRNRGKNYVPYNCIMGGSPNGWTAYPTAKAFVAAHTGSIEHTLVDSAAIQKLSVLITMAITYCHCAVFESRKNLLKCGKGQKNY